MTFAWPLILWLLAVPIALVGWELLRRVAGPPAPRSKIRRAEAGARTLVLARGGAEPEARRRTLAWLAAGLAFGVVALARPQWGWLDQPVYGRSRDILIALDLSKSMLATDVPPSRLERAKLLTQSLLDGLAGERVGLEVFAGTAFLQAPISSDYDILREFLPELGPATLPVGGTDYGALIDTAARAFSEAAGAGADRYLIVLSDGGATDEGWRSHLDQLKSLGVRVIALGVGTPGGALVPDQAGGFLKDERGAVVKVRLEDASLKELAGATGGAYREANQWIDLPALLKSTVAAGKEATFEEKNRGLRVERFQWFLAPALLCLLASLAWEFPVRPRAREVRLGAPERGAARAAAAAAAGLAALLLFGGSARAALDEPPPADTSLARIVGRLSSQETRSARDWAEMARETVDWGQRLQSEHQMVPAGPVADGLAAVDQGSKLDAGLADWPGLRAQLEALRAKPPEKKPPPPQPQPQKQQQQEQQQGGQQQSGQGSQQSPSGSPPPSAGSNPSPQSSPLGGFRPPPGRQPRESNRSVGGSAGEHSAPEQPSDPALVVPLEKLEQVRDQDAPGRMLQLLENNGPQKPAPRGKDW